MNYLAAFMFVMSVGCAIRSIIRDESIAMNAAGLFAVAGCVCLK